MAEKLGLKKGVRNPGSIVNIQHHDASGGQKNVSGSAAQLLSVIPTSTTATPLQDESVLRVVNTTASVAYIFIGREDQVPGTINAASSLALVPNSVEHFFVGESDLDSKSLVVKTSSATVQVTIMK